MEMLEAVCDAVSVPVIASGGAGSMEDFVTLFKELPKEMCIRDRAKALCGNEKAQQAIEELERLYANLKACVYDHGIHLDFSIVNDMDYYNGIIFQGFVDGIPTGVLSGGRYDNLVHKCGKNADALGFAVYMDMLERYGEEAKSYDVDALDVYKRQ